MCCSHFKPEGVMAEPTCRPLTIRSVAASSTIANHRVVTGRLLLQAAGGWAGDRQAGSQARWQLYTKLNRYLHISSNQSLHCVPRLCMPCMVTMQ
jgi:hypothetical protein